MAKDRATQVTLTLPNSWLDLLDDAVHTGRHRNRSAYLRALLGPALGTTDTMGGPGHPPTTTP